MRLLPRTRNGFTLAEVAVTIVIVGIGLVLVLQGLNTAKMTAAHTRNQKLARELALLTLGQIESGLFLEDVHDDRLEGTYADDGHPDFVWEAIFGDANFREYDQASGRFDNWKERDRWREANSETEDEEAEQPYEKVQIKVLYPKFQDYPSELILERWLPWKQVHPDEEEAAAPAGSAMVNEGNL